MHMSRANAMLSVNKPLVGTKLPNNFVSIDKVSQGVEGACAGNWNCNVYSIHNAIL